MKYWADEILDTVERSIKNKNYRGMKICTIKTVNPLVFTYKGVDIGTKENDVVYVHPLMTSNLIEQDENLLSNIQNFNNSTAYNSPEFQAVIQGTLPDFLKEFYLFYKNWQSVYLLQAGDLVAVFELEDDSYLILQKVGKDILKEDTGGNTDKKESEGNNEL